MTDLYEKLFTYMVKMHCPKDINLIGYTEEQGCKGDIDIQVCRNCWQTAIINLKLN